jgi:hypothetical protein
MKHQRLLKLRVRKLQSCRPCHLVRKLQSPRHLRYLKVRMFQSSSFRLWSTRQVQRKTRLKKLESPKFRWASPTLALQMMCPRSGERRLVQHVSLQQHRLLPDS